MATNNGKKNVDDNMTSTRDECIPVLENMLRHWRAVKTAGNALALRPWRL